MMRIVCKCIRHISLSLLVSFISGCDGIGDNPSGSVPVIEGYIDSDGYPVVLFSSSINPEAEGSLKTNVINWGKVTISDGEKEIILTGRSDKRYMPPYKYYTYDMVGTPGKTYRITAEYGTLYAEAECSMPEATPIDRIELNQTENHLQRSATLYFTSPEDVPAYYYISMRDLMTNTPQQPCMMGAVKITKPMCECSVPVLRPKIKIEGQKYIANLEVGHDYEIHLNRVEKEVYEFWEAYDNMVMFANSPFISTDQSLPSNISGGYGIWSPQGVSAIRISVK